MYMSTGSKVKVEEMEVRFLQENFSPLQDEFADALQAKRARGIISTNTQIFPRIMCVCVCAVFSE